MTRAGLDMVRMDFEQCGAIEQLCGGGPPPAMSQQCWNVLFPAGGAMKVLALQLPPDHAAAPALGTPWGTLGLRAQRGTTCRRQGQAGTQGCRARASLSARSAQQHGLAASARRPAAAGHCASPPPDCDVRRTWAGRKCVHSKRC